MMDKLWPTEDPEKGMAFGRSKNLNDINKYVKPRLNTIGLDLTPLVGVEEVRKSFPLNQFRIWSSLEMRFEKGGSGNLHRIFAIEDPSHCLTAQIFILQNSTPTALGTRARFNIPNNIMKVTNDRNRVLKMLELLRGLNVYLYLYIKPALYVLIKYSDIPVDGWMLTYRKDKSRLNRMYVKHQYLERLYKHWMSFESDIKSKL